MIPVSEELKKEFLSGRQKELTLEFSDGTSLSNDSIVVESMQLIHSICEDEQIKFGKCNSAEFSIQIFNSAKPYKGLWVTPIISAGSHSMKLGTFLINEDALSDDRNYRFIRAHDKLNEVYDLDVQNWYESLSFPMTLKSFRDRFFGYLGITQEVAELANDGIQIAKTIDSEKLTARTVMECICEANGVFGSMSNENNFRYIDIFRYGGLYPSEELYPSNKIFPQEGADEYFPMTDESGAGAYVLGSFVWQDYHVRRVTQLQIRETAEDIGVTVGKIGNKYPITGNFLFYEKSLEELSQIATNILKVMGKSWYRPSRVKTRGRPWLQVGDVVRVEGNGVVAIFPILQRTMTGISALYDSYEANGNEYYVDNTESFSSMIQSLKSKQAELSNDVENIFDDIEVIEGDIEDIGDQLTDYNVRLVKTENSIEAEVSARQGADTYLSSQITMTAEQISSKVSKGDVCSEINQSSDVIELKSNRLIVESDNFNLTNKLVYMNGRIEARPMGGTYGLVVRDENNAATFTVRYNGIVKGDQFQCDSVYSNEFALNSRYFFADKDGVLLENGGFEAVFATGKWNSLYFGSSNYLVAVYNLFSKYSIKTGNNVTVGGNLTVSGEKKRIVETKHYGTRDFYAYETPSPYFGDIGTGRTDETGVAYIEIDDIFREAIGGEYVVFLQKEGQGDIWVEEKQYNYFVVKGTPNLSFAWELKSKQFDYMDRRLEPYFTEEDFFDDEILKNSGQREFEQYLKMEETL